MNVRVDEPVTIKLALHLVLQYAGLPDRQITFEDDGVRLVGPEAATGRHVLRTHDLRGASNYSTALRRTFIDRVRHEVAADTWGRDDQAWIHPAASVFGIDVYQSAQVHQQLDELWQRDYVSQDNVRFLFDRRELAVGNLGKEKSPEEVKALAAKLRRTYPLESLGPRLKYETAAAPSAKPPLSPAAAARLTQLEKQAQLMKKALDGTAHQVAGATA